MERTQLPIENQCRLTAELDNSTSAMSAELQQLSVMLSAFMSPFSTGSWNWYSWHHLSVTSNKNHLYMWKLQRSPVRKRGSVWKSNRNWLLTLLLLTMSLKCLLPFIKSMKRSYKAIIALIIILIIILQEIQTLTNMYIDCWLKCHRLFHWLFVNLSNSRLAADCISGTSLDKKEWCEYKKQHCL